MATRSAVGYYLPGGRKVKASYVHFDGSPSSRLPLLNEHFPTLEDVVELVKPGSMSCVWTDKDWQKNPRPPGPLYHSERGDGDPPQVNASLSAAKKWWRNNDAEYLYVYCPDDFTWEVHDLDE